MFDIDDWNGRLEQCTIDELIGLIQLSIKILEIRKPEYDWRDWKLINIL